ncbi:hypothetical protein EA462_12800 [Natrarchaeobius halalkaliphilus]|uniref:DUF7982 domain-containing protein n=1 Tax=Natrarchaeobius halalkaliphilus TaxID=1679091 RepID=A0A3N6LMW7_9EURY|nr:hypothetical protein [Natrarchaeobius halalkaliphilus]RQG89237.1 hypothetical protein EA462_12800 [Natrarchaeobius halalkaliphilus]
MSTNDFDLTDESITSERASDSHASGLETEDRSPGSDRIELAGRIERLETENDRLRREYVRLKRTQHRTRALGLVAIGLIAVGGAVVFSDVRSILVALGATGLFGAVLIYTLAPETVVSADVGERIYSALASNHRAMVGSLGLGDERLYVPEPNRSEPPAEHAVPRCRLFVPRYQEYAVPESDDGPIVTDEDARGLVLEPTGRRLFSEFERGLTTELESDPERLSEQLSDALVEGFELARSVQPDVDSRRVTFAITDSAFGNVDRFDHPIASFLAAGLAIGLEQPVSLEVTDAGERTDWLVTCRWGDDRGGDGPSTDESA